MSRIASRALGALALVVLVPISGLAEVAAATQTSRSQPSPTCEQLTAARDYRGAVAAARDAVEAASSLGDRICLGRALVRIGREDDAIAHLEAARGDATRAADRFAIENGLGMAHAHLGANDAARSAHNRALDASREMPDRALEAASLVNLALGYEQSEPLVARGLLVASLRIVPDNAVTLMTLAALEQAAGEEAQAHARLDRALRAVRRSKDTSLLATVLLQLADAERRRGRHGAAIDRAHEALEIAYRRGDKESEALAYEVLADAFIDRRMPDEAFLYGFAAMAARFAVGDDIANERIADRMKDAFERQAPGTAAR